MKRILFSIALIFGLTATILQAQRISPQLLRVYSERTAAGDVNFFVESKLRESTHVTVDIQIVDGYRCSCTSPVGRNITQGKVLLFTLFATNSGKSNYDYSWAYYRGFVTERLSKKIQYLLPVADGRNTTIIGLEELGAYLGTREPTEDYYAIGFKVEPDEIIHAIRKGQVTKIVDQYDESDKTGLSYSDDYNYLVITHEDGSSSRYSVLKKGSFEVEELDYVNAGDPIALAGGTGYSGGPQVRISTTYVDWNRRAQNGQDEYTTRYITPKFTTKEGTSMVLNPGETYTSSHSEDLVTQEMTKKEKKARKKAKGK